jgi:hypothetical protein
LKPEILVELTQDRLALLANIRPVFPQAKLRLAIQLFPRDFHVVTGRYGVIVLPHDAFDGLAGLIERMDAQHAYHGHDQQETGEGDYQFGSNTHKNAPQLAGENAIRMPVPRNLQLPVIVV